MTAGAGIYREAALMNLDDDIYRPAGLGGEGWWSDAVDTVKTVAKKVQKNPVVRGLEKRAVKAGSDVLRGAAETAVSGAADSALRRRNAHCGPTRARRCGTSTRPKWYRKRGKCC